MNKDFVAKNELELLRFLVTVTFHGKCNKQFLEHIIQPRIRSRVGLGGKDGIMLFERFNWVYSQKNYYFCFIRMKILTCDYSVRGIFFK